MSILNNTIRNGNFTSSEIVALTKKGKVKGTFGAPALTYIEEKNMERRLGRSLSDESRARSLTWGSCVEERAFEVLPMDYIFTSQETERHPTIPYWCGSKDGRNAAGDTIAEIKCPITLKSFCQLVQPIYDGLEGIDAINKVRETHKDGEKYYWQMVSNACISRSKYAELIVYMPYQSELSEIKEMADGNPDYYWIWAALENELPFIKDGGYYKNLNIIRIEVPQEDKDFLTECVLKAGKMLIPYPGEEPELILARHDKEVKATIIEPETLTKNTLKI